jgi:hypothetical protein
MFGGAVYFDESSWYCLMFNTKVTAISYFTAACSFERHHPNNDPIP